jgi:uncharacterized RmlC-like cupin family protein
MRPWLLGVARRAVTQGKDMRMTFLPATFMVLVVIAPALIRDQKGQKDIVGVMPVQVQWFTPSYYTDGRQRAQLYGNSSQGGPWIDRVKIPAGKHVAAHTHPQDELVTVIDGTWYVGAGDKYDPAKLTGYPAGSFVLIPAGLPHFVAAMESPVIVQLSGSEKFRTEFVEK